MATAPANTKATPRSASRPGASTAAPKAPTAATPWGAAVVLEEVAIPQRAGERRFSVVVQLLEPRDGERLVRFAYTSGGSARRGPVTMRARDLERLRAALERAPVLRAALGM